MCTTYMRFDDFLECFVIMCSISPVSTAQIVSAISVEQLLEDGTKNNGPQSDGSLITLLRMKTAALASYHSASDRRVWDGTIRLPCWDLRQYSLEWQAQSNVMFRHFLFLLRVDQVVSSMSEAANA